MTLLQKITYSGAICIVVLPVGCSTSGVYDAAHSKNDILTQSAGHETPESTIIPVSGIDPDSAKENAKSSLELSLENALELAGVENPTINLAREAVQEALARQDAADSLWFPSVSFGANVRVHRGNLQQGSGGIRSVDSQSVYFGAGAGAIGSGSIINPGLRLYYPLADTILEPQAARSRVSARGSDSVSIKNYTLMEVTTLYLELLANQQTRNAFQQSELEMSEIVRLTEAQANVGQGRSGDSNRAKVNLELLRRQMKEIEGEQQALTARFAGMLNRGPETDLNLPKSKIHPIILFTKDRELDSFTEQAISNRPEILARSSELAEAMTRNRQEELRPWLPTVGLGVSLGGFGGGSNQTAPTSGRFDTRTDIDAIAVWNIRNAGLGNRAIQHQSMARVSQAVSSLEATRQQVRREVIDAHAELQASMTRMGIAQSQLDTAEEGYKAELTRIKQAEGRPLEAIDSARQLLESRIEVIRAITDHNVNQFRLLVAIGYSPIR